MDPIIVLSIARRLVLHLARLTWWPIAKLITLAVILLRPFYLLVTFALLPFIHLAHAIFQVVSLPFTVKWLEQIEVTANSSLFFYPCAKLTAADTVRLSRNSCPHRMHHRHHSLHHVQVPVVHPEN